jgi:hypothetical protein
MALSIHFPPSTSRSFRDLRAKNFTLCCELSQLRRTAIPRARSLAISEALQGFDTNSLGAGWPGLRKPQHRRFEVPPA